jgi:signal transduction histidine kinase
MPGLIGRATRFWWDLKLTRQFLIASTAVFVAGMAITGSWIASRIEASVTYNTAVSTALYFESFVAPLVQDLASDDALPADKQAHLSKLIAETPLGRRVISFKIWRRGGAIAYASRTELIGKTFPATPKLRQAWTGQVAAGFDRLEPEEENKAEREAGMPLLEIYAPIRQENSDRIIAVAEFYERAEHLKEDIFGAKLESWLIITAIALGTMAALFGIFGRASSTIEGQRQVLQDQVTELSRLLAQNEELRARVERSAERASEVNERHLRRLGAELHDGPAQLLGLALLRLDAIDRKLPSQAGNSKNAGGSGADVATIRTALRDALSEIRDISVGLSLPALERLSIGETLQAAVRDHVRRTNTGVETDIAVLAGGAGHPVKTAAFRFVQEALNNATRHAGSSGQMVRARLDSNFIVIEVSDAGPGFDPASQARDDQLGLVGMRERIESLGGKFEINSAKDKGTCVRARLPLNSRDVAAHV